MAVRKTWAGVAALVIAYVALTSALGAVNAVASLGMSGQAALIWLLSASGASWLVGRGFWIPTAVVWLVIWSVAIALLYAIAAPTGQASLPGIMRFNAFALVFSAVTAMLGATLGRYRSPAAGPGLAT